MNAAVIRKDSERESMQGAPAAPAEQAAGAAVRKLINSFQLHVVGLETEQQSKVDNNVQELPECLINRAVFSG